MEKLNIESPAPATVPEMQDMPDGISYADFEPPVPEKKRGRKKSEPKPVRSEEEVDEIVQKVKEAAEDAYRDAFYAYSGGGSAYHPAAPVRRSAPRPAPRKPFYRINKKAERTAYAKGVMHGILATVFIVLAVATVRLAMIVASFAA